MKDEIMKILNDFPSHFKYLDSSYKNKAFIIELLNQNIDVTPYINEDIKKNLEIIKASIRISKKNFLYFKKVPWEIQKEALLKNSSNFEYIYHLTRNTQEHKKLFEILKTGILEKEEWIDPEILPKNLTLNRKIADFFISKNGINIKFFPKFNNIKKVVKSAIRNDEKAFRFINQDLKNNLSFIKELLKINSYVYDEITDKTIDLSFFLINEIDSKLFIKLPIEHKKDKKILLRYLQDNELNDSSIDFSDYPEFFKKEEYIKIILKHNGKFFNEMPQQIKENKDYSIIALKSGASVFDLPNNLLHDYSIAEVAVEINGKWIENFSEEIKNNYYIAKKALENDPKSIKILSENLKANPELVTLVLKKDGSLIDYLNFEDRSNEAYIILSTNTYPQVLKNINKTDLKFWKKILANKPSLYEFFPSFIKNNENLALEAVKLKPNNIKFIKTEFKLKEEFLTIALKNNIKLSEIDDVIVFSDLVTNNQLLLKELILNNPDNFLNLDSLNPKLHKNLLLEILDTVQVPLWLLNKEFFADKTILEKALETQKIDVMFETFLYGNEEYVLKAVQNNPEVILDPFNGFIPINEDIFLKAIEINPDIIDAYYEGCNIELTSNFVKILIKKFPNKTEIIFKKFDKLLTKEIILDVINYTGFILKEGKDRNREVNFNFLNYLPPNLKSDLDIILRYIFVGGNNLEYFNFSLKEITAIFMLNNYSSLNYLKSKIFKNMLENNLSQKEFFEIVSSMFDFPNIISFNIIRNILNNNRIKLKKYLKNNHFKDELHFIMRCICFQELYFYDYKDKISILNTECSRVLSEKINYFINLIRAVILENYYKNYSDDSIVSNLFTIGISSPKTFESLKEKLFKLLEVEDKEIKESTIILIKKAFNAIPYKIPVENYQSEFYFSKDFSTLFLNDTPYNTTIFFMKDSKISIRKRNVKYYNNFFESLSYLLRYKSITRDAIKNIFKIDSSKFNSLFNHRLKDRFQLFSKNFNYIFLEEGYELIINWKESKDEPLIKLIFTPPVS